MATNAGDIFSSAKINYARLGHASQSLIPKLLQQLLLFYEPTNKIQKDCSSNSYLNAKLNFTEKNNIDKAKTEGYVNFDIPLIYKLLRNLKLIPPPTRGWEPQGGPMITETTIGDDLERFRKSRNDILHRGNTNVSDQQLTEYFTQFKEIAQRLELVLNKKNNELFSEFENLETDCIDDGSEQILASLAKLATEKSKYSISISVNISNAESTDSRTLIKKPLQDVCCVEGEIACLSCEIIKDETAVTWYKDDVEIFPSTDIILEMHGKIHELLISKTEMKDGGRYSIKVKQSTSEAKLTVKALISNHLVDTTCLEGSTIVLSCEVSVEDISGIWYKDDSIVVQSNQIHPTVNSRIHQLNIFQSEIKDGGKYVFKIRDKISSAILTVKAVIKKHLENVTCIEDQSLSLVCELAEKDISVTWLKDEKVIEASKNIVPEIDNNAHILKFKKLSKNDGGKYALMAKGKKTEAVVLVIAKSTIPDQILQMDEKDKEMYLEIIKSGTERRYYIRLMIVGENGVGKTCLMRRLLGEDIDDVTSTDGIDVVIRKCKIRISDGQWILNEEDTVKQDRNVRMKRALTDKDSILPEEKIREKQAESLLEDDPMETTVTPFGNVKGEEIKNVTEIKDIYTGKVMDQKNDVDMQFTNELKEESIAESVPLHTDKDVALKSEKRVELSDTLSDAMNVELTKDIFADCNVWDFAGQKEFYATHQTFLTNSAIYLLTTDLSKDLSSQSQTKICDVEFDKIGCYIDFWFDTIHCYATTEAPDQSVDKPMSDKLKPPIIIVCTGTDKIKGELSEQKSLFRRQLNSILSRQITYKHVRYIQYLSNKEPLEKDFLELQSTIFKTATEMSSWGKELPLRWIHLETALDGERDAGSNILPFDLVVKLAKESSLPTSDNEEIILFLRYQHECGHVIFFKDLPDYIILNPRWLIDVFKCFVSADQFMGDLLNVDDWEELKETGKLSNTLISMLFEKVSTLKLMKYKEHVLRVLEKFDIIVKPTVENMTSKLYYMPCMIKPRSFKEMRDRFHVDEQSCRRTSWLLLEFEFLPPAFFNHVLVGCIRKFNVNIETGRRLSLYRGISVFDIDKLGNRKLVICAQKNLIAFQIWIYDHELLGTFHNFRQTLTNMVDMLSERYQICSKYKVKLKCSESDYKEEEGRFELKDLQDDKTYYCPEHGIAHACLDVYEYWFSDKYPEGDLEAQAKEEEEAGEVTKKEKQKRDDNEGAASTALLDDNASSFKQARAKQEDERMAEATTSRHISNFLKITVVMLQISPRAVRVQFDKEFHPVHLQRTLNRNISLLTDLKRKNRIIQPQWNLLFPRTGEQPSSKYFDMTLMICLLRKLMHIDIMDRLPSTTDTSLGADLSRIKYYRNIIANCNSTMLDDDTVFESYWNDVTPAILRLGGNSLKAECDYWYGRNLDAEQKELVETNKKLIELEQEQSTELALAEIKKKLIELEQEQSNLVHKNIRERGASTALLDDNASPFKQPMVPKEDHIMAEATTSRHESNYIKIAMVVLQISSCAVRVQFDKEFHPVRLQSILNKDVLHLTNLKMKKRITQHQWNLLFPRTGEQPSSKDFDITLMICLLRNLIPIDIMDRLPLATDTSLGADLSRIKYYRNIIVHCNSPLIDDTDFESYWNDVTPAILRLGGNSLKVECDDWYGRNLDAKQRDDGLKSTKAEERLALVEELAETNKKQIELEQEKRKELVETIKKLIESEQEKCNPVPNNIRVPIIELKGHTFNVDEGKSVAIECNEFIIDEKRPPFWEWIHEDDETNKLTIREDKKDKYLLKSDPPYLWIFNAEMSDRGYYRCCIEYSTSNGEEIVRSKKAHLIVEKGTTSQQGNLAKKNDDKDYIRNREIVVKASRSVGIIRGPGRITGTGFRVGECYIMTALHVVDNIMKILLAPGNRQIDYTKVVHEQFYIQFGYRTHNQIQNPDDMFNFSHLVYKNSDLDTVILQLRPKQNLAYPPSIGIFSPLIKDNPVYLIGHPDSKPMMDDPKIEIYDYSEEEVNKSKKSIVATGLADGNCYEGINNPRKTLFHCTSQHGASGALGVMVLPLYDEPIAVLMLLRGYPGFYYSSKLSFSKTEKENFLIVEQGVLLKSIEDDMELDSECPRTPRLKNEIFGRHIE